MIKILVTGIGAIIGYGIVNSLREINDKIFIVGSDIYPDAVGQEWVDKFIQAPLTSSKEYYSWIEDTVNSERIDLIIPGIEQDALFFTLNRNNFKDIKTEIVTNNPNLMNTAQDKWLMYKELSKINTEASILTAISGNFDELKVLLGLPFLLKPRCSYAGKGISIVNSENDFIYRSKDLGSQLMAQKIIGNDDGEFTVGAFGDGNGKLLANIIFRRKLAQDGSTSKATIINNASITKLVKNLATYFKPLGPTNFQLRDDDGCFKLLEINPRISSSTSLRKAFGYNEAKMCIDYFVRKQQVYQPTLRTGSAIRYIADLIKYEGNYL